MNKVQWMNRFNGLFSITILMALASCNPTQITGAKSRGDAVIDNNDASLDNKAYIYRDSPSIIAPGQGARVAIADIIDTSSPEIITLNNQLTGNCAVDLSTFFTSTLSECIHSKGVKDSAETITPRQENKTYIFTPDSEAFYETNALFHIQAGTDKFFKKLSFAYQQVHGPFNITKPKSIPEYLPNSELFWFKAIDLSSNGQLFRNSFLTSFALCNKDKNASFSPAGVELCFGFHSSFPGLLFVQDPSVIYHELAHALVSVMMNMRNGTAVSSHPFRSNLGSFGYEEAGAINEGIADYYSFVMNARTHFGEWALGVTSNQSRPISESDAIHISGVNTTAEGRLSYPQFILYDPNFPDSPLEDVHYAGQIVSHYLVALTQNLQTTCSAAMGESAHDTSTSYVLLLLSETLSEIGDLNSFYDPNVPSYYFNNLNTDASFLWTQVVNQTSYRRFFQIFAKNIRNYITSNLCPAFTKSISEKLLDDYGLLLFKTYNNNGHTTTDRNNILNDIDPFIPVQPLTAVTESNRRKSVLIAKDLLDLAPNVTAANSTISFFIIDNGTDIQNLLKELLFKGFPVPISTTASFEYNNNNVRISPGEIVALIPNLFNSSNSTMAGVQLLANDWDHVHVTDTSTGNFKPCVVDTVTTVDQGAVANGSETCSTAVPLNEHTRLVKSGGVFPAEAVAPVCLVELEEGTSTRWVSQSEFRKKSGLSLLDKDCLGYVSSSTTVDDPDFNFNPHECLARFLPGANDAFFSKIDSRKTYFDSVVKDSENKQFNVGNLLLMEVSKWIPPGTKFRCRLRARFANCSDCHADSGNSNDDFLDYELNGSKPFKVINFDFDVND